MMLTMLAEVARDAGLHVVEVGSWRTHTRPGGMLDVRTITCHHTAPGIRSTRPKVSLNVIRDGRPGLAGPLAHFYLDRDGTVYVVAAGKCNHAGVSRATDFTNSHAIGIEAEAAGDGWSEDWPERQMDAYARLCAALVRRFGLGVGAVRGHKETCAPEGRKTDPSFDMAAFRRRVAAVLKPTPPKPAPIEEDDMPVDDLLKAPITTWLDRDRNGKRDVTTVAGALAAATTDAYEANRKTTENATAIAAASADLKALRSEIAALTAAVKALTPQAAPTA